MSCDPFRLRVLTMLQRSMQQMCPAKGYSFDMRSSVFIGRDMFGDSDPVPLITILEDPAAPPVIPAPGDATDQIEDWILLIQGFVTPDLGDQPLRPAYILAAETKRAIITAALKLDGRTPDYFSMGGRIDRFAIGSPIIRPADDGVADKAYFWLRLTLRIVENLLDPYE